MASQTQTKNKKKEIGEVQNRKTYIKKVILENFLSFQKDEVDFGEAKFVIIVGPNWSGKTSIFQAIKFVLGSNERDDRYTKWSNFIRNGQNHAMVEIHIQNGDDLLKVRRYVIRGQSPFFKVQHKNDSDFCQVQAHEIQKEILDLKINPDNQFAFVSQGKIDSIKNLKPADLCAFLEEGIGLNTLRDEILHQKRSVNTLNNDLNSLKSRRNTLNITLDLLTPKLERLDQKNKLLTVRKKFSDELLWANKDKLEKDIKRYNDLIENLKKVIIGIKKRKEMSEAEINDLSKKITAEEQNVNKLTKKLGELDYKRQELINKIQNWQKEKIVAKQELDTLYKRVGEIEKITVDFEKQKESLDNELSVVEKEIKRLEVQIESLIREQGQLVKKIKLNKVLLDEYNQIVNEKKIKQSKIQNNEKTVVILDDEINQLFQSFNDIEHKLEKNKWFLENPSKNLLQELDSELRKISSRIYEFDSEIKHLEFEKSKKIKKLKVLNASLRERRVILPSSISILKDEIIKRELRVKGPIIDYLKYEDSLSYAIESVLGEKLLYSFVAEDWDTLTLLKRLKEKYNAYCNIYLAKRLSIQPLANISANGVLGYLAELIKIINDDIDIKKVIYSKVKNCLVVKDYHSGRELYNKLNFKGKCVTLAGEQIISYKYVFETPFLKRLKGLLSAATQKEQSSILESEVKTLSDTISELRISQIKLDDIQKGIFKKKESFNDLLYNFNQKQRITTKKNQLYTQKHDLEKDNSENKEIIKELEIKIRDLKKQSDPDFFKWNDRVNEIPNELTSLNEEKKKWNLKLDENSGILKEVTEELNKKRNELTISKLEFEKKKENFQKADKDAFAVYRQLENTELKLEDIKKDISELKEVKLQHQNEKIENERKIIEVTLNLEQENVKLSMFNQDLGSKRNDLERINSEIGPLISEEIIKIRSIEDINKDLLQIDKELLNFLDIDNSLLVEKDQIISSLKDLNKNQTSLEEDIKAAIKTENKLENTYNNKFGIVLEVLQKKVNQKFEDSQIKSYCSLELKGNFEDLGVDIKAATSKDQLKSFTALSGGQVSLISICLILSLQEIKPSPLCMLDEAGMFLDEKNSEVAYQLIKSTLEQNPIQLFMFLPKSSSSLFLLAEKIIGIARVGENEISSVFKPKLIKRK
ncbi:MAG: AAA family ATPase [Promethearchaeota archaeon]|jgi:chromosome segregation protein